MKWVVKISLVAVGVLSAFGSVVYGQPWDGGGVEGDPYIIADANDMQAIGGNSAYWGAHFELMADIDLSAYTGTSFNLIGIQDKAFSGVFDGNGHTISNFTYDASGLSWPDNSYIGLFRYVNDPGAEIKDLGLINPEVDAGTGQQVGSLVACLGLLLEEGTVTNCYVEGGSVSGNYYVGGLVGFTYFGTITNCYSTGSVSGTGESVGGLVGSSRGTITNCYSTASVSGSWGAGGLVGGNGRSNSAAGGGGIINCYATGSVSGVNRVGGLVGDNYKSIVINCYSTGSVSGTTDVGGLVGWNESGTISASFWDIQASGEASSAGGLGLTTAEMKDANTYIGWGCGLVWTIDDGVDYPHLIWEGMPGEIISAQLSDFVAGAGTETNPYLIYTAEELNTIGLFFCEWDKHFKLMADIDLSGYTGTSFNIIGSYGGGSGFPFSGVFDGNSHTISNFSYTIAGKNDIGLFGCVAGEDAEVKDLGLIDPNVDAGTGDSRYVGSLVGWLADGTVSGCYVEGASVSGDYHVGGLVGYIYFATVSNCYATGSISGGSCVGGLVGYNEEGLITECYVDDGSVSGYWYAGGLVGYNYFGTITDSYSTGSVSGDDYVGGLAGENLYSLISNCYAAGPVSSSGSYVGGLVGNNRYGTYNKCFWDSTVNPTLTGIGSGKDPSNVFGETTTNMQTQSTFTDAGWDFVEESTNGTNDIWRMCVDGIHYPHLFHQYNIKGDFSCPDGVGTDDVLSLSNNWLNSQELDPGFSYPCDPTFDGLTNLLDFVIIAEHWLEE